MLFPTIFVKTCPTSVIRTSQLVALNSTGSVRIVAVPFEEDEKESAIWFLDHNYHEVMFSMFKKINAKEHVVGWYSTGPKLRESDLEIHDLFLQ